uniref:Bone morphogenetic protein 3 n=1 Tax=Neogobius melanostomus TaxID=47308 RepID=A0A8C6S9P1_9GOBI
MARCRLLPLLLLLFAWSHARHGGSCAELHARRRRADASGREHGGADASVPDTLTEHMRKLYAKYARPGHAFKDGNTVRSFKAHWGSLGSRRLQLFNLTSLRSSESVLSATLHFLPGEQPHRGSSLELHVWSFSSAAGRALGHVRFDLSHVHARRGAWQWRDMTRLVNAVAGRAEQLLIAVQLESHKLPLELKQPPYILLYANDSAVSEPEGVVSTLQGHHLPNATLQQQLHNQSRTPPRHRRSVNLLSPLQNNELPEGEYPRQEYPGQENLGQEYPEQQAKKKSRKEGKQKVALLQFDERTMKKARRKWAEPRGCSRRYLKVDFADIGWSDWIISPKAYDAFYCAGSCHFPMNKALKPSNHATIQSIVRAVGVVPGVPEPCCVPEKMSALSILFFDEQANVVLKVYPNMSVDSCACR